MLPLLGAAPTPHSNIGDISGNYQRISTKLSAICLLTRVICIIGIIYSVGLYQSGVVIRAGRERELK